MNNVLAAEGQSVDGSADKAKSWTLDSFDDTTFATTKNGTAVENQLADMDINSWLPGTATYHDPLPTGRAPSPRPIRI